MGDLVRLPGWDPLAELHERHESGAGLHDAVVIVFSFAIAYIAHRGINGSTAINIAINVIQIWRWWCFR